MRLVFDCRSVFPGMGGIGRATACLARELPRALPEAKVYLLLGARRPEGPLSAAPNVQEVQTSAAMIDPLFEQVRLPGLLAELEADVYHGTCFAVPLAESGTKRVATVHDVVFRRLPHLVDPNLQSYLDRWTGVACQVAEAVVTVSEFSRREITDLYGLEPERIHVVGNAVEPRFFNAAPPRPNDGNPVPGRGGDGGRPYLLYVGAIEEKKNVPALLRSFAALIERTPDLPHVLRLAGGRGGAAFDLEAALSALPQGVARRVEVLGHVPDEALPDLYAGADLFCYLSEYEGFGLPPLEAMATGTLTLVAERASLPEVTAGAALLCDPRDPEGVAEVISRALTDQALRERMVPEGLRVARRTSWARSAAALAELYRSFHRAETPVEAGAAA